MHFKILRAWFTGKSGELCMDYSCSHYFIQCLYCQSPAGVSHDAKDACAQCTSFNDGHDGPHYRCSIGHYIRAVFVDSFEDGEEIKNWGRRCTHLPLAFFISNPNCLVRESANGNHLCPPVANHMQALRALS